MDITPDIAAAILHMARQQRAMGLPVPQQVSHFIRAVEAEIGCSPQGTTTADQPTDWLTTTQLARKLGCSRRYATRLAPRLGGVQHGRRWFIPADAA